MAEKNYQCKWPTPTVAPPPPVYLPYCIFSPSNRRPARHTGYSLTQAGSRCHHVFHLTTHTHGREPTIEDFYCAQHKAQAHVEETADGKSHRCVGHNVDGKHCHHIVGAGHGFFCPTHKDQDPYA